MKCIIVLATLLMIVTCAPPHVYQQRDRVSRSNGVLQNVGTQLEAIEVRGTISWTAPDGQVFNLNFVSDENGYRPEGAHLPHL